MAENQYPRAGIANQINDLQTMRGKIEDLKIAGYNLISGFPDAPKEIVDDLQQAIDAMEDASRIAQTKARELYDAPTPVVANDDREEAA